MIALLAVGSSLTVHIGRFLRYHRHKGLSAPPLTLRAVRSELGGLVKLAWWSGRAVFADGLRRPATIGGPVVVALHGYSQNATNMWGIRRALEAMGRPTVGISMRHRLARLERYVDRVEHRLDALSAELGDQFDVVAHSMGGVVLRMLLVRRPDLRPRLRRVVTLGSPHRGTASVRGLGWTALPELRAMHRRSALLAELPSLGELLPDATLISVAGTTDTVVYPVSTSLEPTAHPVVLHDVGHAGLLTDAASIESVCEALR